MNALPQSGIDARSTPGAQPRAPRSGRLSLVLMLLLTLAGVVLVLWAVGRAWAEGTAAGLGATHLAATGHSISGVPSALALVGLASSVAVFAVRRTGRLAVGTLVAIAGAGAATAAAFGASDTSALDSKAAASLALTAASAQNVTHTGWPWVAVLGGVLMCAAGVLTLLRGRDWPGMSSKYDAPTKPVRAVRATGNAPADLWKALDRGEDPTDRG